MSKESQPSKELIWNSRLFKGGLVGMLLGVGLGIGLVVELGAGAAAIGAGWHAAKGNKSK